MVAAEPDAFSVKDEGGLIGMYRITPQITEVTTNIYQYLWNVYLGKDI